MHNIFRANLPIFGVVLAENGIVPTIVQNADLVKQMSFLL